MRYPGAGGEGYMVWGKGEDPVMGQNGGDTRADFEDPFKNKIRKIDYSYSDVAVPLSRS